VVIDLVDLAVRAEGTSPTGGEGRRVQVGNDDARSFARDPGHFGDGFEGGCDVTEGEGAEREIGYSIGKRNTARVSEAEVPAKAWLVRSLLQHLGTEIGTEDLRTTLPRKLHPAAGPAGYVEKPAALEGSQSIE